MEVTMIKFLQKLFGKKQPKLIIKNDRFWFTHCECIKSKPEFCYFPVNLDFTNGDNKFSKKEIKK
jgi:hypothetical protein